MRSICSSVLKFGELGVGINVKIYKARDSQEKISFHNGCECGNRLTQKNVCETCNKDVAYSDIVKLFNDKGTLIPIDKDKLPKLNNGNITIDGFTTSQELFAKYKNPMLAFRDYYLVGWDKKKPISQQPLSALHTILAKGLVGYGTMVMRSTEHKIALMSSNKGLLIVDLANPNEIRDNEFQLDVIENKDLNTFVDNLNKPIQDSFWINHTSETIKAMISGTDKAEVKETSGFLEVLATTKKKKVVKK